MVAQSVGPSAAAAPAPSSAPVGLSTAEVERRRAEFGFNEVVEATTPAWRRLLQHFWGPIPWMIEVALVLAGVLEHWDDFAIILTLLGVNALVGFWEEYQAGNAVAALKANLAPKARVLRDGAWTVAPARELVPGDVVRLRGGDIVPADLRLLDGATLDLDQSAITGESLPTTRAAGESAYAGSIVQRGEGNAEVTVIGARSYLGRTTLLVSQAQSVSHLQRALLRIGDTLIALALALAVLVEVVSLMRGVALLSSLQFALVLTVAAIPVAMPTVLSVTMAVGARNLAREGAIVTHLEAVEELAGIDVLCADKTGTLTQNRLTAGEAVALAPFTVHDVLEAAVLASRAEDRDAIDEAILQSPGAAGLATGFAAVAFEPFDPVRKRTEATVRSEARGTLRVSKGAPQAIVALAGGSSDLARAVDAITEEIARRGQRALGVARREGDGDWRVLGIVPLFDPLRPDSAAVVARLIELGVEVKMATGDQAAIARETAHTLGLSGPVRVPEEWTGTTSAEERRRQIASAAVLAQVFPEHKYDIVRELQQSGRIVGMTGDGVNDAPALKQADVGLAVAGATDAARAAADVVLTRPGLSVITRGVEQARQTFARMTSYAIYRIEETIRLLLFIALAIIVLGFFPVTALMIVLIALLNDGAILAIAFDRAPVDPAPVAWRMDRVLRVAAALGISGVVSTFLLLELATAHFGISGAELQTLVYLKLSVAGHFVIFLTRSEGPFYRSRPAGILVASVLGTQLVASTIALEGWLIAPIPLAWVAGIWGYAAVETFLADFVKRAVTRSRGRGGAPSGPPPRPWWAVPTLPWRWFVPSRHRHLGPEPTGRGTARAAASQRPGPPNRWGGGRAARAVVRAPRPRRADPYVAPAPRDG